jgi:hypothetical protein
MKNINYEGPHYAACVTACKNYTLASSTETALI